MQRLRGMNNLQTLQIFLKQLTTLELVALRHDAIQQGDDETKKLIDEEMKRRINQ